jgi:hypothetical protein
MGFGCGHIKLDENIHEASWGARLIYSEIIESKSGHTPVVWDRQTPDGDPETVRLLFPVVDKAIDEFRKVKWELSSDSRGHLCWRDGRVLVVMSPQGSYGYLYVTAVLEREGHVGESDVWAFEEDRTIPQLGNWPPEVVAAKLAKEREYKVSRLKGIREWELPHAQRELRWAAGKRTEKSKQRALDKVLDEIAQLEFDLGEDEITREGKAMAAGGLI